MPAAIQPPVMLWWGSKRVFLSAAGAPPSQVGDGVFQVGDLIINDTPTAGGIWAWVCTTAGPGGTAVFSTMPASGYLTSRFTLSAAQIKVLNVTPVAVIPAAGANKIVWPWHIVAQYIPGTVGFNADHSINGSHLLFGTDMAQEVFLTMEPFSTLLQGLVPWIGESSKDSPSTWRWCPFDYLVNAPLLVWFPSGFGSTTGNGTIVLTINYQIVDVV